MRHLNQHLIPILVLVCLSLSWPLAAAQQTTSPPSRPQSTCPIMGGTIGPRDKALHVDVGGKRIYICCAACEAAVRADPEAAIKKISERGETVEEAPKP